MLSPLGYPDKGRPGYELFVSLLTRHEPALRRFARTLLPGWGDVDEVMQRTALAAWRKFAQFDPQTDFLKWALVVARFEALAYRRAMGRDRLLPDEGRRPKPHLHRRHDLGCRRRQQPTRATNTKEVKNPPTTLQAAEEKPTKPNLISLIAADDIGHADLKAFGDSEISTTHLGRVETASSKWS